MCPRETGSLEIHSHRHKHPSYARGVGAGRARSPLKSSFLWGALWPPQVTQPLKVFPWSPRAVPSEGAGACSVAGTALRSVPTVLAAGHWARLQPRGSSATAQTGAAYTCGHVCARPHAPVCMRHTAHPGDSSAAHTYCSSPGVTGRLHVPTHLGRGLTATLVVVIDPSSPLPGSWHSPA